MPSPYRHAVHLFRRDLRISDNTALHHASKSAQNVTPLYVLSQWDNHHLWTGSNRQQFLCHCLKSLQKNLTAIGGRLIFRRGSTAEVIRKFLIETNADALYFNHTPDPFGRATEVQMHEICKTLGVDCHSYLDHALHGAEDVLKKDGSPYRVYTPYSKRWLQLKKKLPLPTPTSLNTPTETSSEPLPTLDTWRLPASRADLPEAGEKAATQRLHIALSNSLPNYQDTRNFPAIENGTSQLSQDLRHGTLSIREVYHQSIAHGSGLIHSEHIATFHRELAWREFYMQILYHHPDVLESEFNPSFRGLPWDTPDAKLDAWKNGLTGFPFVDAGMRQLLHTGTMHNRVRMVTSMFLCKDLHYDWRLGEQHFMHHLIDGEISSNNGGWQWSAGTGADAAPYFRIQNPWTQSKRYDPEGQYIRRWIPELKNTSNKRLHQEPTGQLSSDYPPPILDHSTERKRTLAMFKHHLSQQR